METLSSFATGVIAVVLIAVAWLGVQLAWRKVFPRRDADPDALAGRMGCHGGCKDDCDHAGDPAACSGPGPSDDPVAEHGPPRRTRPRRAAEVSPGGGEDW